MDGVKRFNRDDEDEDVLFALLTALAAPPIPSAQECRPTLGQQVVSLINRIRAAEGLPLLAVDVRLVEAARSHGHDMAVRDRVAHEGSDGSEPADRATAAGYPWSYVAENLAAGYPTAQAVVDGWMQSRPHRANILSADAHHIGIGHVLREDTQLRHYWAASFGTAPDRRRPPRDCHP